MIISKKSIKSGLSSTCTKSIGGLTAAITIALAALLLPVGLTVSSAQTLENTITIDSVKLNKDRTITVFYTITCAEESSGFLLFSVTQSAGKFGEKSVRGFGVEENLVCDSDGEQYSTTIVAEEGFFTSGRAVINVGGDFCGASYCDRIEERIVVRISR